MRTMRSSIRLLRSSLAFALVIGAGTSTVAAQVCPGDCNGDGRVTINEIVVAVTIVLGLAPPADCAALGPAPVRIDRVVAAVNSAQCACRPCPPPPPTQTPTVTPLPATATPRPTATMSVRRESTWREDNARLGNSTCRSEINQAIREELPTVSCPLQVVREGNRIEVVDCDGVFYEGSIDGAGDFTSRISLSESAGPCSIRVDFQLRVNLGRSPSTANYTVAVDFSGACGGFNDCQLAATTRWTLLSGTVVASTAAGERPRGLVGRLLPALIP